MMQRTIIKTADGSHSLYVNDLDEHYHSIHGAIAEAMHVFIKNGLQYLYDKRYAEINILEIGLGTGLNALLTSIESEKLNIKINYTALEAYPLSMELINELNYIEQIGVGEKSQAELGSGSASANDQIEKQVRDDSQNRNVSDAFHLIHSSAWEKDIAFSKNFSLHKIQNTLQEIKFNKTFDLIYFDAFGPRVQPEMWTEDVFSKIYNATNENGCLVTYCAKGEVKRTLKKVGYTVETLPGPPRKREMVRGTKTLTF